MRDEQDLPAHCELAVGEKGFSDMLRLFNTLFPKPRGTREHHEDLEQMGRDLVTRYARGNVRLQQGKYMTRKDADKLKEEVLRHRF